MGAMARLEAWAWWRVGGPLKTAGDTEHKPTVPRSYAGLQLCLRVLSPQQGRSKEGRTTKKKGKEGGRKGGRVPSCCAPG